MQHAPLQATAAQHNRRQSLEPPVGNLVGGILNIHVQINVGIDPFHAGEYPCQRCLLYTSTSIKVSYSQVQTAGDLNLVAVGWNDTSATVQSVTDTAGNIYTLAAGPLKGTALTQSIYYAKNILAGSNAVTVTFSKAALFPDVRILEYKGLNTTAPLDVTAGASGTSGSNATVSLSLIHI